jgi:hypothetical protein
MFVDKAKDPTLEWSTGKVGGFGKIWVGSGLSHLFMVVAEFLSGHYNLVYYSCNF